jgi:hypothetical protein
MKTITACSVIVLTAIFYSMPSPAAQRYGAGDVLVVLSKSGLTIREKADMRAKVLALAPCGALVTMEGGPAAAAQTVEGIAGGWARVTWNGITGYAFDGFLGRMRAPEEGCENLEDYFNDQFKAAGSPVEKVEVGEGTEERITETAFSNGAMIVLRHVIYQGGAPDRRVSTFTLPGIERIEEVFLVLRLLGYIDPAFPFPAKSGRAGVARSGAVIMATVMRMNNECRSLEMVFRGPDYSGKKSPDIDLSGIIIRREGEGIIVEMRNMKR